MGVLHKHLQASSLYDSRAVIAASSTADLFEELVIVHRKVYSLGYLQAFNYTQAWKEEKNAELSENHIWQAQANVRLSDSYTKDAMTARLPPAIFSLTLLLQASIQLIASLGAGWRSIVGARSPGPHYWRCEESAAVVPR